MQTFKVGTPVTWRALSASQRQAQRRYKDWVIAREKPSAHLGGDVCLLIAPVDHMHEARWVKQSCVTKAPEPVKEEATRRGVNAREVIARGVATTKHPRTGELMVGRRAYKRADAILSNLAAAGFTVAPVKLLDAARACMRETGWQLAPANIAQGSEGILELACAEVCEQMGDLLIAAAHHAMLAAAEKEPQP